MRGPDGKVVPRRQGILTFVATRESGDWKVRTPQNTDRLTEGQLHPISK
jgi:hypothetical protein